MKIDVSLDVNLLAVQQDEELTALVELTAPSAKAEEQRAPCALVVVLDRSGSMAGDRLDGAKQALTSLVTRLRPDDVFGLVVFDTGVDLIVPASRLGDKAGVIRRINRVSPGGCTDLAAGYLRGLQEARRVAGDNSATVLLISDGHANAGLTDADQLADIAAAAAGERVSTSALGFGLGYDETLLSAIARGGRGNELFAEDADAAGALIAGEVDGLLSQSIQAASLLVRMSPHVRGVRVVNDTPSAMVDDGLLIELGGFYADEVRKLLMTFSIPGISGLGLAEVATLELRFVDMALLREQVVKLPLHANVVPGDEAAGRLPDPAVVTELAFQQAQQAKRSASIDLTAGDSAGAVAHLLAARSAIGSALPCAPAAASADLHEESDVLERMLDEARYGNRSRAAKLLSADSTLKSRNRGRRRPSA